MMTIRQLLLVVMMAATLPIWCQTYSGRIADTAGQPLANASVILLDTDHKSVCFGRSQRDGVFSVQGKAGRNAGYLVFSCVGHKRDTIAVSQFTNGQTITMVDESINIREVTVRADRVTQHGDTLNYNVAGFKQKQDRSIADVIKKMPGLDVKADGTIEYEGKAINKFYVEGMDLMGSKYAQTSENLDADKVKTVQVLQNHQPIKALKDINFSEQAALNIVLQDDAKNVWQGLLDLGVGHSLQGDNLMLGDNRLMAMMFGRRMQSVSMFKQNNTGKDIAREVGDIGALLDYAPTEGGVLSNISLPAPSLDARRARFNQTHVLATNWLFKTPRDHDLRLQLNGKLDMTHERQYSETQYTDVSSGITVIEENIARSHNNQIDGELQYKANTSGMYLANTLKGYLNLDYSHGNSLLNGLETRQHVKPRRRYVSDQLQVIKNLSGGRIVQASAYLSANYLPGQLLLTDASWQHLNLSALMYGASTGWSHQVKASHWSYRLSHDGKSQHYTLDNPLANGRDTYSQYRTSAQVAWAYQTPVWRINASLPLSLLVRRFDGKGKTDVLLEPQVFAIIEPSTRWQLMLLYNYAWQPLSVSQISAMPVFTNYINMQQGNGVMDDTRAHIVTGHIQYKNTAQGFFAQVGAKHTNLRHMPLYESTLVDGIYSRHATDRHTNGQSYAINGRVSNRLNWANMNIALAGAYSWNNHNLLQSQQVMPTQLRTATVALSMATQPLKWLSVEARSGWSHSQQVRRHSDDKGDALQSWDHSIKVFVMPGKWQIEWTTDLCHSNDRSVSTNTFSDFSVSYRTKRYELGVAINNLMGNSEFERRVIATTQTVYTLNRLRPRELVARALFNL